MAYIFIPIIIGLVIMVLVSLVRGIVAFMQSTREDLEHDPGNGPSPMQLKQNKMMFARIKYQALAIVAIAFLAALSHH
ncbi:MAG: HIG1 domain-containing protein [Pseudomonadota bacterium]|nr:HIG1 domain-containing protein [Pseudomonadota bacterium]